MRSKVTVVAYPTIPVVFNASVHEDRVPLHNTMGLAVTDLNEEMRSETSVEVVSGNGIDFTVDGKPLEKSKILDVKKVVAAFEQTAGHKAGLKVASSNHKIFSGSSDSGAAALVYALNELFETQFDQEKLAALGNTISETTIRSVYGGLNLFIIDAYPRVFAKQLASEADMKDVRIFAMGFDYPSRITAEEIFQLTRSNPFFEYRLKMVPQWIAKIKLGLLNKDWNAVFSVAEENCANAHYLIESAGKRCRKKEMMNAVIDVEEIRASGLPVYWVAGGGKVISAVTWEPYAEKVRKELVRRGQKPIEYKVASAPKVTSVR